MKKITLILILLASFATQSFAYCPIPQWCPDAPLHQTLCPGDTIETIEFPSVIAKTLIITWWTNETRIYSTLTPPPGITVSGDASTPLGEREYAWPVSIKGAPTGIGTHHYTVSNTCGVELLHGSITLAPPTPATPGTITFSPTSVCPGEAFTASIAAVSGATSYNWTTPASMTDDGSDGTTITITDAGTTTGTLAISVTATNACGTSAPSTANITIGTTPNTPGTITFNPASVCPGDTFTASIAAVSGATTYNWTTPSNMTDNGSNSTSLSVTNAGSTTGSFEVSVTAIGACGASSPSTANITVNAAPTIGSVTPTTDQTTELNTPFANTLTISPEPIGTPTPTIQWWSNTTGLPSGGTAVSGATGSTFDPPNDVVNTDGVYYYAVATNSCGTATSNVSGRHTVVTPLPSNGCSPTRNGPTFEGIGTQYFKTNTVWTISGNGISQEWSDVVLTSTCGKTGFTGGSSPNFNNDCRENRVTSTNETRPTPTNQGGNTSAYLGDFFSWCAVMMHAAVLCPDTWRVPTSQDFINLDIALGGTGLTRTDAAVRDKLIDVSGTSGAGQFWGGAYVGICNGTGSITGMGVNSPYWSSSEATTVDAYRLFFNSSRSIRPQEALNKGYGFALRCVRDVP